MSSKDCLALMACLQTREMREPPSMWRVACKQDPEPHAAGGTPSRGVETGAEIFCLHLLTKPSVGGMVCMDCGGVVAAVQAAPELSHRTNPVMNQPAPAAQGTEAEAAARREWDQHVRCVMDDQPVEMLHHAWAIFQRVYATQGAVSGKKARALVLVSLLYSSRLLHGDNRTIEEGLLRRLAIPTRIMNKAFSQMAAVTLHHRS